FSVACALVARRADPERRVLAVTDEVTDVHEELLEVAAAEGLTVPVEVWQEDGDALDADAHLERLEGLVAAGGRCSIATDPRQLEEMIDVAGPIVAWTAGA
ncbi:MAG: hypothetical protein ACRDJP_04130, partial [Actinomycetota bacterium]